MSTLTKRDVLIAIAALAASSHAPAFAQIPPIDLSAGRDIGAAYLAAHPVNVEALRAALAPSCLNQEAVVRLRVRAARDFTEGRIFRHNGWILSETEAQLFALLAT